MANREKVISNLQVVYEYLHHFENTAKMREWVADALALLKGQADAIKQSDRGEGHWIQQYDATGRPFSICSECRTSFAAYDKHRKNTIRQDMSNTNFCPCCGADMRTVERMLGKDVWSGIVTPIKKRSDKKSADGMRGDSDDE